MCNATQILDPPHGSTAFHFFKNGQRFIPNLIFSELRARSGTRGSTGLVRFFCLRNAKLSHNIFTVFLWPNCCKVIYKWYVMYLTWEWTINSLRCTHEQRNLRASWYFWTRELTFAIHCAFVRHLPFIKIICRLKILFYFCKNIKQRFNLPQKVSHQNEIFSKVK